MRITIFVNEIIAVDFGKKDSEKIIIDQSKVIKTLPRMVKENFQSVPGSTHTIKK